MTINDVLQKWADFPGEILPCFRSGTLVFVRNASSPLYENRELLYQTKFIMSDGIPYNLHDAESVRSIQKPRCEPLQLEQEYLDMGVTGQLDYILKRKAVRVRNSGNHPLSIALLRKSCELMPPTYPRDEFLPLYKWLAEDGCFDEAETELARINQRFTALYPGIGPHFTNYISAYSLVKELEAAKKFKIDLLRARESGSCCEGCALHRGRIYSISGKSKAFPPLPDYRCDCMGITFSLVTFKPTEEQLARSRRPYLDDRDNKERRSYQDVLDKRVYQSVQEEGYLVYYRLKQLFPKEIPKSFAAFSKARNEETESFLLLAEKAKSVGISLRLASSVRDTVKRHKAYCKELGIKP